MTKLCSSCETRKSVAEFYVCKKGINAGKLKPDCKSCAKAAAKAWRGANPDRQAATLRAWKKRNPEKRAAIRRRYFVKKRYGITTEQYDLMLGSQGGVCAICKEFPEHGGYGNSGRKHIQGHLAVDHDHETGAVRGLLCRKCNLILGNADDDSDRLRAAAAYLDESNNKNVKDMRPVRAA